MTFKQSAIDQIRLEHSHAPRGTKTAVVKKWAGFHQCSENKIWAVIPTKRKRKKDEHKTKILQEVTEIVFQIKHRVPDSTTPLSTDLAIAQAKKNGLIPQNTNYSPSSIDRMGREMKLNKKTRRIQRFQAERPNQMHHVDGSTSQFFYVAKALPDGDYILKLHGPAQNYKNKPTPIHQRLWIYGLTDDYSGYTLARYIAATGESMVDNQEFMQWAWEQNDDKPFCGVPEKIKADKGPMMRGNATKDVLERVGVVIDPSVPGAKDAHGKIERPWRTHWQRFEKQFLVVSDWKKFEIKLSELNRQFLIYLHKDYNCRPHRYEKDITREQAWRKINLFGGIKPLPKGAFRTAHKKIKRKVHRAGTFSLDNKLYEVKGLHDAWVNVLLPIFDEEIMVQDLETGEKYEVIDFKPNPIGKFTAHKDTPYQKCKKAGQDLPITGSLFEEEIEATNVVTIPIRVQEEQPFDHVFDTGSYASLQDAMGDFMSMTGEFPQAGSEDRAILEQLLTEKQLSKSFVRKLADDCIQMKDQKNRRYEHG